MVDWLNLLDLPVDQEVVQKTFTLNVFKETNEVFLGPGPTLLHYIWKSFQRMDFFFKVTLWFFSYIYIHLIYL